MLKVLSRSQGFTLIELMIVILIIAILIGIAVPVYLAANTNAKQRTCQANLRTIEAAINSYLADANVYPTDMGQMASGTYRVLKEVSHCPTNGSAYSLTVIPGSRPYVYCPDIIPGHNL